MCSQGFTVPLNAGNSPWGPSTIEIHNARPHAVMPRRTISSWRSTPCASSQQWTTAHISTTNPELQPDCLTRSSGTSCTLRPTNSDAHGRYGSTTCFRANRCGTTYGGATGRRMCGTNERPRCAALTEVFLQVSNGLALAAGSRAYQRMKTTLLWPRPYSPSVTSLAVSR